MVSHAHMLLITNSCWKIWQILIIASRRISAAGKHKVNNMFRLLTRLIHPSALILNKTPECLWQRREAAGACRSAARNSYSGPHRAEVTSVNKLIFVYNYVTEPANCCDWFFEFITQSRGIRTIFFKKTYLLSLRKNFKLRFFLPDIAEKATMQCDTRSS